MEDMDLGKGGEGGRRGLRGEVCFIVREGSGDGGIWSEGE
jgi:hypothetical protein